MPAWKHTRKKSFFKKKKESLLNPDNNSFFLFSNISYDILFVGFFVQDEMNNQSSAVPASNVNKAIQLLAQKYCGECKSAFDELSKIIQVQQP